MDGPVCVRATRTGRQDGHGFISPCFGTNSTVSRSLTKISAPAQGLGFVEFSGTRVLAYSSRGRIASGPLVEEVLPAVIHFYRRRPVAELGRPFVFVDAGERKQVP